MMDNNLLWNELKEDIQYDQLLSTVRRFWYSYTEGFFTITNSYSDYCNILRFLQNDVPLGWNVALDFDGTIHASIYIEKEQTQFIIQKDRFGKEYLQLHPIK